MGSLFSKPKAKNLASKQILEKDRAILNLKIARDKLRKFRMKLETDSKKLELQAKELVALRLKNRALLVLKLKRFKEKELDGIDSKLLTVQTQINDLEWATINVSILNAIESGTRELNRIHEERSLEDVELLMDETNDAIEVENRINLVLAGQLSALDEVDLESELELIMKSIITTPTSTLTDTDANVDTVEESSANSPANILSVADSNTLTLPDVPTAPILPLVPTHALNVDAKEISDASKPALLS